jgi:hypothetical protein
MQLHSYAFAKSLTFCRFRSCIYELLCLPCSCHFWRACPCTVCPSPPSHSHKTMPPSYTASAWTMGVRCAPLIWTSQILCQSASSLHRQGSTSRHMTWDRYLFGLSQLLCHLDRPASQWSELFGTGQRIRAQLSPRPGRCTPYLWQASGSACNAHVLLIATKWGGSVSTYTHAVWCRGAG